MMFFTPENKERKKRKIEHKTNSCPFTSRYNFEVSLINARSDPKVLMEPC